jgi:hypothetical protein
VNLVRAGNVTPLIGSVVGFDELPAATEAMANRASTGRTIVRIDSRRVTLPARPAW